MFLTTIGLLPFSTLELDHKHSAEDTTTQGSDDARDVRVEVMKSNDGTNSRRTENHTISMEKEVSKGISLSGSLDKILSNPIHRVLYGFSFTFLFLLIFLLLYLPSSSSPGIIPLNIFSTFVGIADATSSSGVYVAASSPLYESRQPVFSSAATFGAALSGFIVSLLRLATRSIYEDTDTDNDTDMRPSTDKNVDAMGGLKSGADSLIWLAFGFVIILIGAVVLVMVDLRKRKEKQDHDSRIVIEASLVRNVDEDDRGALRICSYKQDGDGDNDGDGDGEGGIDGNGNGNGTASFTGRRSRISALKAVYLATLKITWKPTLSAFLNFFITLSLFPGVIVSIPSATATKDSFSFGAWMPIVLITMFNFSDCAGRFILGFESWCPFQILMRQRGGEDSSHSSDRQHVQGQRNEGRRHGHQKYVYYDRLVWYPTIGRILFYPLLALCILPSHPRPLIHNDILSCILLLLFGGSSGFIHCANFTVAPTMVNTREGRNATSILLLMAIYSGLCLGAYFGLVVEKVIRLMDG